MRKFFTFIWEIVKIAVIAAVIVVPIRYFLFQPFFVRGQSMNPSFENGDYLIIDEISYRFKTPQRGEVIVFKYPQNPSQRFIKRVIGLPGETVEIKDGEIIIYKDGSSQVLDESEYLTPGVVSTPGVKSGNTKIILAENEYFVLGDNRSYSFDSRRFGVLPEENIIGRVIFRAWPFVAAAKFETPAY